MPNKTKIALELLQSRPGACIASNADGEPEASYAPFIWMNDTLYLLISELASHTKNLRCSRPCSLLLLEEAPTSLSLEKYDPFARTRMTLEAEATFIARDTGTWEQAIDAFSQRHGETAQLLSGLPDFNLVALSIISGSLIEGFGKAFEFKGTHFDQSQAVSGR